MWAQAIIDSTSAPRATRSRAWRWLLAAAAALLGAAALGAAPARADVLPQTLFGDPLEITDDGGGTFEAYDYSDSAGGSLTGALSLLVDPSGSPVVYGPLGTEFDQDTGPTLDDASDPQTLTSEYSTPSAGGHELAVTQTIKYHDGARAFSVELAITNNDSSTVSVVPKLVADIAPGFDEGAGQAGPPIGALNPGAAYFIGAGSTSAAPPPVVTQEAAIDTLNDSAGSTAGDDFTGGVDSALTDAAVGLQYGTFGAPVSINPGETLEIAAEYNFARLLEADPQEADSQPQGGSQSVAVAVNDFDGQPKASYGDLRYEITGDNPHPDQPLTVDSAGHGSIDWTGTNVGDDTLTVYDDLDNSGDLDTDSEPYQQVFQEWFTPPPPPTPAVAPDSASAMAGALSGQPGLVTGAAWTIEPPGQQNVGPADRVWPNSLLGFPTEGGTFALMTSGDANLAGQSQQSFASASQGNSARGANDVSVLRVDLAVPQGASCLAFDFQFLSEEYPDFVGSINDAFLAELDTSDWSVSGSDISAPHNFALDADGNPISINASGIAQMSADNAAGTVYGGATQRLQANTPITPGAHSVYFTIFDASDSILDSAAFIDALRTGTGTCAAGTATPKGIDAPQQPVVPQDQTPQQIVLPPPVRGVTANAVPEKGTVLVKLPRGTTPKRAKALGLRGAATGFIPLEQARQVPIGSTFDTKKGTVGLTTAAGAGKADQTGSFSGGRFKLGQRKKNPLTSLTMKGGGLGGCKTGVPRGGAKKPSLEAARKRRRSLFSSVHGRFRTRGRNSTATVRGTQWTMTDTCRGTVTSVKEGAVKVRDLRLRKTKLVKAGHRYLARAPMKKKGRRKRHM